MSVSDAEIGSALDRLLPRRDEAGDWDRVLERARGRRPAPPGRAGLALAVALVACAAAVTALGAARDWWFLGSANVPRPVPGTGVVVVERGRWNAAPWMLVAYRSETDGLCFGLSSDARGVGDALACAPFAGVPPTPSTKTSPPLAITYLSGTSDALGAYAVGPVVPDAAEVVVALVSGEAVRVQTRAAPGSLGTDVRFYATQLPPGAVVRRVTGLDRSGREVAHLDVPRSR